MEFLTLNFYRAEIPTKHVVILSLDFEGKFDAKGALMFRPKSELKIFTKTRNNSRSLKGFIFEEIK